MTIQADVGQIRGTRNLPHRPHKFHKRMHVIDLSHIQHSKLHAIILMLARLPESTRTHRQFYMLLECVYTQLIDFPSFDWILARLFFPRIHFCTMPLRMVDTLECAMRSMHPRNSPSEHRYRSIFGECVFVRVFLCSVCGSTIPTCHVAHKYPASAKFSSSALTLSRLMAIDPTFESVLIQSHVALHSSTHSHVFEYM